MTSKAKQDNEPQGAPQAEALYEVLCRQGDRFSVERVRANSRHAAIQAVDREHGDLEVVDADVAGRGIGSGDRRL